MVRLVLLVRVVRQFPVPPWRGAPECSLDAVFQAVRVFAVALSRETQWFVECEIQLQSADGLAERQKRAELVRK